MKVKTGPAIRMTDVADHLGLKQWTLRKRIIRGTLPPDVAAGTFKENIYPATNARWMMTEPAARELCRLHGVSVRGLKNLIEQDVRLP